MRDVVRNKERWEGAVRLPKILVLDSGLLFDAAQLMRPPFETTFARLHTPLPVL